MASRARQDSDDRDAATLEQLERMLARYGSLSLAPKNAAFFPMHGIVLRLVAGDHVAVCKQAYNADGTPSTSVPTVWHHGVFIGVEDHVGKVIHMVPDHMRPPLPQLTTSSSASAGSAAAAVVVANASIVESTWDDFTHECNTSAIVEYDGDSDSARAAAVAAAKQLLAYAREHPDKLRYRIGTPFVCDGFATYCKTGRWEHGGRPTLAMPAPPQRSETSDSKLPTFLRPLSKIAGGSRSRPTKF